MTSSVVVGGGNRLFRGKAFSDLFLTFNLMISKLIARSARLARPTNALRRGGHGTPSYNEPGGYLFAEKVNYHTPYLESDKKESIYRQHQ